MREANLPAWALGIGAEVREHIDQLPVNEPYLVDVTELLRAISERELAERGRRVRARRASSRLANVPPGMSWLSRREGREVLEAALRDL
jgi:hypothetical protein